MVKKCMTRRRIRRRDETKIFTNPSYVYGAVPAVDLREMAGSASARLLTQDVDRKYSSSSELIHTVGLLAPDL